jgi:hypothetical protein
MAPDPVVAAVTSKLVDKPQEALRKDLSYYNEELKVAQTVEISIDLVLAAKRQLGFLRTIDSITSLHSYGPAVLQAIQRWALCKKHIRLPYQRLLVFVPQKLLTKPSHVLFLRYQNCWMPLAAEAEDFDSSCNEAMGNVLLPPVDVQWVWHCHCLSPVQLTFLCSFSQYVTVSNIFFSAKSRQQIPIFMGTDPFTCEPRTDGLQGILQIRTRPRYQLPGSA